MVAVEAHGAAQLHGVLGQRHLEEGDVAAGDHLQHAGPVAVVGGVHVCGDEGGKARSLTWISTAAFCSSAPLHYDRQHFQSALKVQCVKFLRMPGI